MEHLDIDQIMIDDIEDMMAKRRHSIGKIPGLDSKLRDEFFNKWHRTEECYLFYKNLLERKNANERV